MVTSAQGRAQGEVWTIGSYGTGWGLEHVAPSERLTPEQAEFTTITLGGILFLGLQGKLEKRKRRFTWNSWKCTNISKRIYCKFLLRFAALC